MLNPTVTLWTEAFPYPDGNLAGNGDWTGLFGADPLQVESSAAVTTTALSTTAAIDLGPLGATAAAPFSISFTLERNAPLSDLAQSMLIEFGDPNTSAAHVSFSFDDGDAALDQCTNVGVGLGGSETNVGPMALVTDVPTACTLTYDGTNLVLTVGGVPASPVPIATPPADGIFGLEANGGAGLGDIIRLDNISLSQ